MKFYFDTIGLASEVSCTRPVGPEVTNFDDTRDRSIHVFQIETGVMGRMGVSSIDFLRVGLLRVGPSFGVVTNEEGLTTVKPS